MKKIIDKLKEMLKKEITIKELCLFTFIISLCIISIIYVLNDVTPFGDISLLQIDFYHQYGPMLGELYDRVHHFSSLIYSFTMGLGLPVFRNFLNYMSSPLNIIMFFFKRKDLLTSFSVIIGLKVIITSVTMVYYLSKKYKTTELYLIPFGLIYAFSAYFAAYYWNLMWIDGMLYLPLITLGIEKIIDTGKWKLYTVSLALMLLTNYYIAYMICIFACLYFVIYSFNKISLKKGEIIKSIKIFFDYGIKFFNASLLAAGIVAIFLIPLYFSLTSISATGGTIPKSQYYLFTISDFFKYHFSGVVPTVLASGITTTPNVSCGILSFSLALAFIINTEVPIKEKISYIILLGFFILAFFYAPLDYILQGFHVPNDLPYRYSFIYSFILVVISFYSFKNIKKLNYRLVTLIYLFLSITLLIIANSNYESISNNMIYTNIILLSIYFILYTLAYNKRINLKIVYIVMILLSISDVILSINENFNVDQRIDYFYSDYDSTINKLDYIKNKDDELFYRIEKTSTMTLNDSSWYNYHGMTSFSSMNYEDMAILQNNLGIAGNNINSYIYNHQTPIYDTMFDIKYIIGNIEDNKRYTLLNYEDAPIYEYKYNVGLAYGINNQIYNWNKEYTNPFAMQNEYMKLATSIDNILIPLDSIETKEISNNSNQKVVKYTFNNPGENLYFYNNSYNVDFFIIDNCLYYNNDEYNNYNSLIENLYGRLIDYHENYIINFKSNAKTVDIYIGYNYEDNRDIKLYTINSINFKNAIQKLQEHKLYITSFKESKIEGNIELDDNMTVYTSIPYDEGWHVLVDNKKVKTKALAKALLTFEAPKGSHKIVIYHKIKGLGIGIITSLISITILCTDKFIVKKIMKLLNK